MEELDYKKLAQEKKDAILNDLKELIARRRSASRFFPGCEAC